MRVTTAYNRMLGLPGAWVRDVEFGEQAMIVTVALRRKRPVCSGCGARGLKVKDHRVKRWRRLDVGGVRCQVECRLRRLYCPGCGDLPEHVEWARSGARYTYPRSHPQMTRSPRIPCLIIEPGSVRTASDSPHLILVGVPGGRWGGVVGGHAVWDGDSMSGYIGICPSTASIGDIGICTACDKRVRARLAAVLMIITRVV